MKPSTVTLENTGEAVTTSTHVTTIFKETSAETTVDSTVDHTDSREWTNYFSVSVPPDLTERSFQLGTFTWTSSTTLQTFPLIGSLSQSTGVQALFKLWRMARCSFTVLFKVTTSQFFQGAAFVGWLPCVDFTAVPRDIQSLSAYNATVISASKKESVSLSIPYCSPESFFDTRLMTGTSNEHATVFFMPLFTLLTTNPLIPAAAPIEVWGTIKTIDLSGAQSQMSVKDFSRAELQMANNKRDQEAAKKERMGKDAAVGSVIRNTSQLVRHIPVIGSVWSPIADVINTIFGTELSKPTTSMPERSVTQRYMNDVNQSDGLTTATTMSLYQNPRTKVAPTMFGMDTSFKSWRKFGGTPMLFDQAAFDGVTTLWETHPLPSVVGSAYTGLDYLHLTAKMFRYFRGSIKYLFYFCAPVFYAVRFRISLASSTSAPSDANNLFNIVIDVSGDLWVPITIPIVNWRPLNDQLAFTDLPNTLVVEQINAIVGAPAPSTSVIYMAVFRAGGEDMQWQMPIDPINGPESGRSVFRRPMSDTRATLPKIRDMSSAQYQMNIKECFNKVFEPIAQKQFFIEEMNNTMSEPILNVIDLMKRQATYASGQTIGATTALSAHKIIAASFMWQRGGIIFRHIHRGNTSTHKDGWYLPVGGSTYKVDYGWSPAYQSATQFYQEEAIASPWYCSAPYTVTPLDATWILNTSQKAAPVLPVLSLGTPDEITLAAGDDWVYLFQVPWANQLFVTHTSKPYSTKGLINTAKSS